MRNVVVIFLFSLCSLFTPRQSFAWEGTSKDKNTQKPVENAHIAVNSEESLLFPEAEISPKKGKYIVVGPTFSVREDAALGLHWGEKHVVFFPENIYEKGTLEKVEFAFSKNSFSEKDDTVGYKMPVMLKIYARDTLNDVPGEELLKDTIMIVGQKKNRKVLIDISSYQIKLPPGGIYCGVEAFSLRWYVKNGYLSKDNMSYTIKPKAGGGRAYHSPVFVAKSNKKQIYQNYQFGGFAKKWENVTTMYNVTLIIRLHIKKTDED